MCTQPPNLSDTLFIANGKKQLMKTILTCMLLALFLFKPLGDAAADEFDAGRMQRDLRIAEGIIQSLHRTGISVPLGAGPNVRGLYIESYGVLFLVEGIGGAQGPQHGDTRTWIDEAGRHNSISTWHQSSMPSEASDLVGPPDALRDFLRDYAGAIGQLNKKDRVGMLYHRMDLPIVAGGGEVNVEVIVGDPPPANAAAEDGLTREIDVDIIARAAGSHVDSLIGGPTRGITRQIRVVVDTLTPGDAPLPLDFIASELATLPPPPLYGPLSSSTLSISAQKSDIDSYRRGKIDVHTLDKRTDIDQRAEPVDERVSIFARIVGEFVRDASPGTHHPPSVLSGYQVGLGAIIVIDAPLPAVSMAMRALPFPPPHRATSGISQGDPIPRLQSALSEAVVNYGTTLRGVGDDERIIVDVRWPANAPSPQRLYMEVSKGTVDAFVSGNSDRAALEKAIAWRVW